MSIKTKVAIIGSGPAGYSAAIYNARAQLKPIVLAGREIGGQLMYTTQVENFPGFDEGIMGPKLMASFKNQAEKFGSEVRHETVYAVDFQNEPFKLWTQFDQTNLDPFSLDPDDYLSFKNELKKKSPDIEAESVIIATGATALMLGLENEERLLGRGVSTCAVCDAAFFKDKKVFVVGGGDSAMEDALALANFTNQVTIVHRRNEFRASKIMQQRVLEHEHITVLWNSEVIEIHGEEKLEKILVETNDKKQSLDADGLFFAIGHRPVTSIFRDEIELTANKYIATAQSPTKKGLEMAKSRLNEKSIVSYPTMTSVEGVFAAGDVVDLIYRQAITASGMGVAASLDAESWLSHKNKK